MKIKVLFALITFQSTSTLAAHLGQGKIILEASVISAFCILGFIAVLYIVQKDFKKGDVMRGIVLGVFMGFMSQVMVYFWPTHQGIITIGCIVICMFPNDIFKMCLKFIAHKIDKYTK